MVSSWALLSIVPLMASNLYALKQIEKLRNALNVKREILGPNHAYPTGAIVSKAMVPSDVLYVEFEKPARRIQVTSSTASHVIVAAVS